jgi:hypothetical protein
MRVLEQGGKFVQSVKYSCELTGLHPGPPRLPLQPLTTDEKSKLERVIATLKKDISEILVKHNFVFEGRVVGEALNGIFNHGVEFFNFGKSKFVECLRFRECCNLGDEREVLTLGCFVYDVPYGGGKFLLCMICTFGNRGVCHPFCNVKSFYRTNATLSIYTHARNLKCNHLDLYAAHGCPKHLRNKWKEHGLLNDPRVTEWMADAPIPKRTYHTQQELATTIRNIIHETAKRQNLALITEIATLTEPETFHKLGFTKVEELYSMVEDPVQRLTNNTPLKHKVVFDKNF